MNKIVSHFSNLIRIAQTSQMFYYAFAKISQIIKKFAENFLN